MKGNFVWVDTMNFTPYSKRGKWLTGIPKSLDINTEMLITKINTENPEVIEKRAYYENMPYDKKFWESYNIIFDGE